MNANKLGFDQKCFEFAVENFELNFLSSRDEFFNSRRELGILRVAGDAIFEIFGLADVEDLIFFAEE